MLHAACTAGAHYSSAHPDWGPGFNKVRGSEGTETLSYLMYSRVSFLWKLNVKVSWWNYLLISSCHPFRESQFADFQHCPSTRDALGGVQSSVLRTHALPGAKEKTTWVQSILVLALCSHYRLSIEVHLVNLGRQCVHQQILSFQEVLALDKGSLNEKYSQPIEDIWVHKA